MAWTRVIVWSVVGAGLASVLPIDFCAAPLLRIPTIVISCSDPS